MVALQRLGIQVTQAWYPMRQWVPTPTGACRCLYLAYRVKGYRYTYTGLHRKVWGKRSKAWQQYKRNMAMGVHLPLHTN